MDATRLPTRRPPRLSLTHFVILMIIVVAIQGTYLGYVVGILSALERRFGLSSEMSGLLLSLYDIGHTIAILVVGYFGSTGHLPRITGIGVILSSLAMFLLALPVLIYGPVDHDSEVFLKNKEEYALEFKCDPYRDQGLNEDCRKEKQEHMVAYTFLALGQVIAGVCAAPFNTLAYVYIDANVIDKRQSPFFLGLLTSTYAFGPALGFAFAAGTNRIYTTLGGAPPHLTPRDDHWVGAWWLGFMICGILYLLCAAPFFFFPKSYRKFTDSALLPPSPEPEEPKSCSHFLESLKAFPLIVWDLARNPVFVSMVSAWVFGSYLIGGYQTYLPKYIETQFGRSASTADIYAGFISIGAVAASTALGGWVLSRWNVAPRRAILLLLASWSLIFCTYLIGMLFGCDQPEILGLQKEELSKRWTSRDAYLGCSSSCRCSFVFRFEPVNYDGNNFFSPCHAGCTEYNSDYDIWESCECAGGGKVEKGLLHGRCAAIFGYIPVMFIGLFAGNLFFMVTMMIVLRSVYDDQKVMALSLASCATNLFGFIPAPIIFGWVIDSSCVLWNSRCEYDRGNCVVYDNSNLRVVFHSVNAGFQALAVILVGVCWFISRTVKLPEEEDFEEEPIELQPMMKGPPPHHDYFEGHGVTTLDHELHNPKTSTPKKPHDYVNLSDTSTRDYVNIHSSTSENQDYTNVIRNSPKTEAPKITRNHDYVNINASPPRERPPPKGPKVTDL